jgi:hypothetical protein
MGGDPGAPYNGRINIFSDADASVADNDPRLITREWNVTDAVPVGAELFIYNHAYPVFIPPFQSISNPNYFDIKNFSDLVKLHSASFTQVKQVNSITLSDF